MDKIEDIVKIEEKLEINLAPCNTETSIINYENRNTYQINDNNKVIGLNLMGNKITEISFLENLKFLTTLNLANNQIRDISVLEKFVNLKNLDLNHNFIKDLRALKNLTSLSNLILWNNEIKDISSLEKLQELVVLDLSYNQITDISVLKNKIKLTELLLFQNTISNISILNELKNLEVLNLGGNNISNIIALKNLKKLTFLNLSDNIIYDITVLKYLKKLKNLYLNTNFIDSLLPIKDLTNLNEIDLNDNPIKGTTLSDYSDLDGVKGYLESLRDKTLLVENYSIKINILGTGRIGKTQLFRWLKKEKFIDKDPITHGTGVTLYNVNKTNYNASLWDFGGQSYQHGTHSLFLRPTDFYLVLYRSVEDSYGYSYWIGASRNFSLKKIDNKYNNPLFLVQSVWSTEGDSEIYPDSKKIETYQIDTDSIFSIDVSQFSKNNSEWKIKKDYFINSLNQKITNYAKSFGKIPKEFIKIKDEIISHPFQDVYILNKDFKDTFAPSYSKTEYAYLLQYLEFTGCIIYFKEKSLLENYIFTNPKELSEWIYQTVLNENFQKEKQGILSFGKLIEDFGEDKAWIFRELMADFNLMFKEPSFAKDSLIEDEKVNLIIPQFLPENNSSFKKVLLKLIPFTFSVKFEDFIYEGRIFNFISEYGQFAEDKSAYWKYGILFRQYDIQAIVYYDIENRIINVHLENKKESINLGREILDFFILKQNIEDYSNKYRVSKFLRDYKIKYEDFNNAFKNKTGYSLSMNSKIPLEFEDYLIEYFDGYESINENNDSFYITDFSYSFKKTLSEILSEPRKIDPKDVIIGSQISTNNTNYIDIIETLKTNENILNVAYCVNHKKSIPLDFLTIKLLNMSNQKLPKVFISYSRKDLKYKNILKSHLSILEQYDLIKAWSCDEMIAGKWNKQIQQELEDSEIIIYMVSHNFMDSNYIMEEEVKKGIKLAENDPKKKIICVLVGVCQWQNWSTFETKFAEKEVSKNFLSKDLSQFQFLPYHQYKDNLGVAVREEIVALEKWGRYPYDVENEAYNQIVNRVLNEIKN